MLPSKGGFEARGAPFAAVVYPALPSLGRLGGEELFDCRVAERKSHTSAVSDGPLPVPLSLSPGAASS